MLVCQHNNKSSSVKVVSIFAMNLQLTVIYISSDANKGDVTKELRKIVDVNFPQLILGDFNFHHEDNNCLTNFLRGLELSQIVTEPTHIAGRTLDQVYVSKEIHEKVSLDVQFKYYSDHSALQIKFEK